MKKITLSILSMLFSFGLFAQGNDYPLFVVNGKPVIGNPLYIIQAQDIATLVVVKDKEALTKYGEAARSGAIEVITKNNISIISYSRLLDSFHIKSKYKSLPVFVGKYYLRDKQNFYALRQQVKDVRIVDSASRKFVRITLAEPSTLYIRGQNYYLVNGKKMNTDCINLINPAAVRSVAYLNYDEAGEIYGKEERGNVVIYLNKDSSLQSLSYFYNEFHIADNARNWPLFYAGTDKKIGADGFLAIPSMVKNMQVNEKEMRVDICSNEQPAQTEALKQRIKNATTGRGRNLIRTICTISRQTLLQQYVKK